VAITVAVATAVNGGASDAWRAAVREEAAWNAGAVELLRHTYEEQAPLVLDVALAEEQSRWLDAAADREEQGQIAAFDGTTLRNWAFAQRQAQDAESSLFGAEYRDASGGASVSAFLAEEEGRSPALRQRHADPTFGQGDARRATAERLASLTLVWVLVFFVVEALAARPATGVRARSALRARRRAARRGVRVAAQPGPPAGSVPRPWLVRDPSRRAPLALGLAGWLLVGVLPLAQMHITNDQARAAAMADRLATRTTTAISGSGQFFAFATNARQELLMIEARLVARQIAALDAGLELGAAEAVSTQAQEDALPGLQRIVEVMTATPSEREGISGRLSEVLSADVDDWRRLAAAQEQERDDASTAGERAGRLGTGLLLATLTVVLSGLASDGEGVRRRAITWSAGALLAVAVTFVGWGALG
jgi:hypothetical protein